jgi:hypothetical protein
MPTSAWNIPDNPTYIDILELANNPAFIPTPPMLHGRANTGWLDKIGLFQVAVNEVDSVALAIAVSVICSFIQHSYSKSAGTPQSVPALILNLKVAINCTR